MVISICVGGIAKRHVIIKYFNHSLDNDEEELHCGIKVACMKAYM